MAKKKKLSIPERRKLLMTKMFNIMGKTMKLTAQLEEAKSELKILANDEAKEQAKSKVGRTTAESLVEGIF